MPKSSRRRRSRRRILAIFFLALALVILSAKTGVIPSDDGSVLGAIRYLAKGGDSDSDGGESVKTETTTEAGIRIREETKEDESKTEIRLSEEERIRVRTKDGRTRIDITSGGVKTRLEYRDDRVVIKAEQEDGATVDLPDDTLFKIEQRLGARGIKVATAAGDAFRIDQGSVSAQTRFPLAIDLATNTLMVNTPAGERSVAVLPQQAVDNLIAANVISRIGGVTVAQQAQTGALTGVAQLITLGQQNGVPVYEVAGVSDQRFLGLIPVSIPKAVTVSAETGVVIETTISPVNQLLDLLSI